ncbi:hypothetical protein BGZ82_001054 [Podila clonocystis]|nr:hypothetical protein BGZ82_001054 [Podila clonocystis]
MKTVSQKDLPTDPLNQHHHHHHHHPHHQHPLALAPNILDIFPTSLLQPSPAAPSRNHGFKMGFDGEGSTFTRLPDYLLSPAIQPPKSKLLEILDQRFNDPRENPEGGCVISDSETEDECESAEESQHDEDETNEEEGESSAYEGHDENEMDEEHLQPQIQGHSPTKKHRHTTTTKGDMFHEKDPLQAQVWTLFTTAKCSLPNGHGRRLENLTWRLKGMSLNKKEEKGKKGGEEEATRKVEDGMEVEVGATHDSMIGRDDTQDVLEAAQSVSEAALPTNSISSDAPQTLIEQQQQQQQQQWLDLQLQQGPSLDTLLDTSAPPTIPLPTLIQDQPHPLLFPDDFAWIDSAMDPETLRVLSDFEMPEGAMWTAEAQKQLQIYLQSSNTPSDQVSSSYPPSIPASKTHVYDDVFNSNEDEDEHEHEDEDGGNDTDSTVTDLDPHLDANRMQDFDNDDSDVEESRPKSKPNSAPVVVVQPPMHCNNCKTQQTSLWRRGVDGQTLCNACALFYKLHGRSRPKNLKSNVIKTRNRASMAHPSKKKLARNQPSASGPAIGTFPASSMPSTKIGNIPCSETPDKNVKASATGAERIAGQDRLFRTSDDDVEQAKLISEMKNLLEVASSLATKSNLSESSLPPATTTSSSLQLPMSTPTISSHWEFSSSPATPTTSSGQLPIIPPTSQPHFQGDFSSIENNPNYYSLLMDPISVPPYYHQTMGYFHPPAPTSQPHPPQQQQFLDLDASDGAWTISSESAFMSQPGTISYVPVLVPVHVPAPTPCNNINTSSNNTPGPGPFDPRQPHQQTTFLGQQDPQQQEQQFYQHTPWGYHRM